MILSPPSKGTDVLKGFKDFLMRGNVVELAVAVIIGTAFTAIVTAIADHLIRPVIAAIGGTKVTGLAWTIVPGNAKSTIDFAAIFTALLNFLIIAAIVYFMFVLPLKKLQERRRRGEEPGPSEPTDVEVLMEIRDLLRQQSQTQQHVVAPSRAPFPGGGPGGGPYPGGAYPDGAPYTGGGPYPPRGPVAGPPGGPTGPMGPNDPPGPAAPPPPGSGPRNR
jgi:large conductance mechanosensitive channel